MHTFVYTFTSSHRYKWNLDCLLRRFTAQHRWWAFAAAILKISMTKWLKNWSCTLPDRAKMHPFISILNMGACLKYLPKGSFYLFMLSVFLYNAAILWAEDLKSAISDFVLIEILQFAKVGKTEQSSFTHDLVSLLVYEPLNGNTGVAIFMPTSKCSLPVAGSRFLPAFDHSSSVVKWSLIKCDIH